MISGIGCIAYDRVLFTNALWSDGKGKITKEEFRFGGNIRNALAAVASLGEEAAYLGTVSDAPEWKIVVDGLESSGISTEYIDYKSGSHPAIADVIILKDSDRYIAYDDSSLQLLALPSADKLKIALSKTKLLMVDSNTAPAGTLAVMKKARELNIPIVLDSEREGIAPDEFKEVIALATEPILPYAFAVKLTGETEIALILKKLWNPNRSVVIVTDGAKGSFWITAADQSPTHTPVFDVNPVDSNGTGDVFHGAYAVARVRGKEIGEAIVYATAAAASFIALPVGAQRVPSEITINQLLSR
jgi:sugar/nucleoside kinase (ribokinase family)